jgi:hypothetical protein
MGINSTFKSFVHSEVKTSRGFQLVEAYLTYKELHTEVNKNEYSDFSLVEDVESLTKDDSVKSDDKFPSDLIDKNSASLIWLSNAKAASSDTSHIKTDQTPTSLFGDKLIQKRTNYYQSASAFSPKGTHIDARY